MTKRRRTRRKPETSCTTIDHLPNDILMRIFCQLPQYAILPASQVCRLWYHLISGNGLLDVFVLRVVPGYDEARCLDYEYYITRTSRQYRRAVVEICNQHSLLVAIVTLRKIGPDLKELKIILDHRTFPNSYFQLYYERLKDLEMGLEEFEQMLWEQEIDSYVHCMRTIARPKIEESGDNNNNTIQDFQKPSLGMNPQISDTRTIEEVFLAFVYRHCFQLKVLHVRHQKLRGSHRPKVVLYEGTEMSQLVELEIHGTDFIILADFPNLQYFTVNEIYNDDLFDNQCLQVISKRCHKLIELTIILQNVKITQKAFRHLDQLQYLRKLSVAIHSPIKVADGIFEGWPKISVEKLYLTASELSPDFIWDMMRQNDSLIEFVVTTRAPIPYELLNWMQQTNRKCHLTCRQNF
ncbi:uncharacterized protein LOC129758100 isoform X2 [Uranotaenia lowii]|uniref:uncharacterized protein LOC129758100 isoform X2 n=1 Tax=Uranotaenia lowii TaxID=190385 RepID=UPI00247A6AAD|nr:uncharacterized protein LOC129758100 isoform X2 [Uranotaenia lowii]